MGIYINNKKDTSYGIYVMRPSVLGNPFVIGRDGNRNQVIKKYRVWLWTEFKRENLVYQELIRLLNVYRKNGELSLLCCCAPLPCHAEVIRSCLLWMNSFLS